MDIFSGSNTTGKAAEDLGRRWISMEERLDYAALSAVRFLDGEELALIEGAVTSMEAGVFTALDDLRSKPAQAALPL